MKTKQKRRTVLYLIIIFSLLGLGIFFWLNSPYSPIPPAATPADKSTFSVISYVDGEDVSGLVPLSIWTPKAGEEFTTTEDIYDLTKYTETVTATVASLASLDLSEYDQIWVETQPTGATATPFANNYQLYYPGGVNAEYTIYGYDQVTDVNGVVVDADCAAITVADYQTDGNFTILYDCPHYTTTAAQLHYGTNWATTAAEFADLTATQQERFWDEKYWAGEFGTFVPGDFTYKSTLAHPNLAGMTSAFGFKITFNTTVSIVDGAATQVNFTLTDNSAFEVCYSAEHIYLISYSPILFSNGVQQLHFEMSFAANITLSSIYSMRIPIEQSGNAFGTPSTLSSF